MAYVEDWWFNQVFAGNPEPEPWASADWEADNDWEWHSADQDSAEELRTLLDESIARLRPDPRRRPWHHRRRPGLAVRT